MVGRGRERVASNLWSSPAATLAGGLLRALRLPLTALDSGMRLLRCDALIVGYLGQLDMILCAPAARLIGRPVVFNPLVTLTDTIVEDRKLVAAAGLPARLIERIDRYTLRRADVVLVDTRANGDFLVRRFGLKPDSVVVLPVGVDPLIFHPPAEARSGYGDEMDVLFYGKFIPLHGIETIIRAARIIEREASGIRFELVGTGQQYDAMRGLARDLRTRDIRWTDWLPFQALGERLRRADVALGIFNGGTKASRVIPNKVHQALACGVPVVTRSSPAIDELLADRESALLVPPDDPAALAAALVELRDDFELRARIGAAGLRAWRQQASDERLAAIAGDVLERIGVRR
jgi:glycosyltransferase involved in cell wall biosynthesis